MNHPYITKKADVILTSKYIYIIKEYTKGGNLKECLDKYLEKNNQAFSEEIVQFLMRQIIEVMKYLYNKHILHRDLKLQNILINYEDENDRQNQNIMKGKIKVTGFGFARYLEKGKLAKSILGTPLYMPPIILNKLGDLNIKKEKIGYDEKEEIWNLGIICYELLMGETPFNSENTQELINKVNKGDYYVPMTLSKEAISFLNCMLQNDSKKRLSVDELYHHNFLKKNIKEFNKLDLEKIKKYIINSKIKINTKKDDTILKILEESNPPKDFDI